MNKKLFVVLAVAFFIPHSCAASQSTQHDSTQASESQIAASATQQKPQKVYHIGGDVRAPRVITSSQPPLDEQPSKQLGADKKSARSGSTILSLILRRAI